ncbi:ATP-binding cassette domain-containing protein, partial [candidate division KSB1 bacterium]|nr:ATP-binding cassette domain-containing protein [candidate division KSB1 bacterium]
GERQRVALARAIIWEPSVLLLDEPTHSLDYTLRKTVLETLQELNRQLNLTLIHITHDPVEARQVARTVGILNNGRLVESGTKEQVFMNPRSDFVKNICRESAAEDGNRISDEESSHSSTKLGSL